MKGSPEIIGRYVVRERLGQGGMGVLYLALDPAIDRLVAVKLLGVQSPELRERFVREAGLAGRLQHPNIVTVFDVGTHEGQPFIAMEYIPGETLGELIHRRAPLSLRRRLELIVEACQGLAFAHRHGIVHRDVKPANLMVSRDSGALKVLDFGIARGIDSSLTQAGMVMGTPNYMSPEQLEGRALDHRSDVFALGLVLYEVLGYKQAFTGDTPQAVWHQIARSQPQSVLELNPNLDAALVGIIDRAIAKRVEDRYADLDALRAELLRVIHRLQSMQSGDTLIEPMMAVAPTLPVRRPDLARLAERRATQIAAHLKNAEEVLASGDLERAQEAAEEAALLDPNDPRVLLLLERIRRDLDAREVSGLVAEADSALHAGSLTSAASLVNRALQMNPSHPPALALRTTLQQAIEARERAQERARTVGRAIEQAEAHLAAGALETALRATSEALGYDPTHPGALALKARLQDAIRQRIDELLEEARADVAADRYAAAVRRLELARPRDERVDALAAEIRGAWAASQAEAASDAFASAPGGTPESTIAARDLAAIEEHGAPRAASGDRPPTPSQSVPAIVPLAPSAPLPSPAPGSGSQVAVSVASGRTPSGAVASEPQAPASPVTPPGSRLPKGVTGSQPPALRTSTATFRPEQRRAQAHDYLERARTQLAAGDYARSLSLVDAALALDPTRVDAHDLRRHIDNAWAANELSRPAGVRSAGA